MHAVSHTCDCNAAKLNADDLAHSKLTRFLQLNLSTTHHYLTTNQEEQHFLLPGVDISVPEKTFQVKHVELRFCSLLGFEIELCRGLSGCFKCSIRLADYLQPERG
jgi:hypothetical protein